MCWLSLLQHSASSDGPHCACAAGASAVQQAIKVLQDAFGKQLDQDGTNIIHSLCTNLETHGDEDGVDFSASTLPCNLAAGARSSHN